MHEFMEFYRMDYTSNIFVNESNYQGNTDRAAICNLNRWDSCSYPIATKLGLKEADKKKDKPLLALIIGELLGKTSSADGNQGPKEKAVLKDSEVTKTVVSSKATEEAVSAPVPQEPKKKEDESEDSSKNQKSL